jgi:leucyl aminopeptidase (aminopeptidase T)
MSKASISPSTRAKLAQFVLKHNLQLRPGEQVIVEGWTHTLPWTTSFAREARRIGAQPMMLYEDEPAYWDAVEDGAEKVLGDPPRHEWAALAKTDVYIHFYGPGDRVRLNALPEKKSDRLLAFNSGWYAAAAKAGVRGARMELGRPYPTLARAYGVSESKWMDALVRATMVDPERLSKAAAPIARSLEKGKRVRIRDEEGTDLTLGLAHRRAQVSRGRLTPAERKRPFNMLVTLPSGAVRVALDESVADGTLVGNRTCYYDDGKATGVTFRFRNGKLTDAEFERGGERFFKPFKKAGKGRDQPGWLGIGLNPALRDTPQVEDVERGAITVSVGGNRNLGGRNAAQFFGWVVNAGATVEVDGSPLKIGS